MSRFLSTIRNRLLPVRVLVEVALIASALGAGSMVLVDYQLEPRFNYIAPITIIPASVITWLVLAHFIDWHYTFRAKTRALLIGAVSPLIGCVVGLLYCGAGLFWFLYLLHYYYIAAPCGMATGVTLYFTQRHHFVEKRGFPVIVTKNH
jgi:hypothetical protein